MKARTEPENKVIEPEILDEHGRPIHPRADRARPQGDTRGVLGGVAVLVFGFLVTVLVAAFTLLVVCPLVLLGRLFGWEIKQFKH